MFEVSVQYRKYEYSLFLHEDHFISNNIIKNLLHQISIQHNDNHRNIKKSHSSAAEEILDYGVVFGASCHIPYRLSNRLQLVDISWLSSQCFRKEHSYPLNTSMASTNGFQVAFLCTLPFDSSMTMRSHLNKSIDSVLVLFLHCTSMLTIAESSPQVLFAVHLYSPA